MALKHFLQFNDLTRDELEHVFERTRWIKSQFKAYQQYWPLTDRTLVMIFEKASTRTRLSFEAGMQQLGGSAIYLNTRDSQLGRGEPVEDAAQVISRMSDLVMIRTFEQEIIERFAANGIPSVVAITDLRTSFFLVRRGSGWKLRPDSYRRYHRSWERRRLATQS